MANGLLEMPLRRMLATLARSPKTRFVGRPPERPNNWHPGMVRDSEGYGFTDAAAWELIGECLEDPAQRMETLVLDIPKGATAYVMKIVLPHLSARVYVKFEFLVPADGKRICGRSFHPEKPR